MVQYNDYICLIEVWVAMTTFSKNRIFQFCKKMKTCNVGGCEECIKD